MTRSIGNGRSGFLGIWETEMQPIIQPDAWAQGVRSAAICTHKQAWTLAPANAESWDSFWLGRSHGEGAMQHGAWTTLGLEAGSLGLSEPEAEDMLALLKCPAETAERFWAAWRSETSLRDQHIETT
jgi:hypothetical protein